MSTSSKVGELFRVAGQALTQLGELTTQLHPTSEPPPVNTKWTDVEIDMMLGAVRRFCTDLNSISDTIKNRTISQIHTQMKRKAFEDAGLSLPSAAAASAGSGAGALTLSRVQGSAVMQSNLTTQHGEVTLSALNATTDTDLDLDSLAHSPGLPPRPSHPPKRVKLELDTSDEGTAINVV